MVKRMHILIVDDEELMREGLGQFLTSEGHHIDYAVNGADAVEIFRSGKFDLIFMDVDMPIMDGITAFEEIRSVDSLQKIIFLTANTEDDVFDDAVYGNPSGFLYKPFDMEKVRHSIDSISKGKRYIQSIPPIA